MKTFVEEDVLIVWQWQRVKKNWIRSDGTNPNRISLIKSQRFMRSNVIRDTLVVSFNTSKGQNATEWANAIDANNPYGTE